MSAVGSATPNVSYEGGSSLIQSPLLREIAPSCSMSRNGHWLSRTRGLPHMPPPIGNVVALSGLAWKNGKTYGSWVYVEEAERICLGRSWVLKGHALEWRAFDLALPLFLPFLMSNCFLFSGLLCVCSFQNPCLSTHTYTYTPPLPPLLIVTRQILFLTKREEE